MEEYVNTPPRFNGDALQFWLGVGGDKFPCMVSTALSLLSIPATSAPVERMFSHGGIIMRPHRSSMSSKLLSELVFLKCNRI